MGLCKTSIFYIYLKFRPRSYSSCVYHMMRSKGSNGKVCKMMTSHFRTLCYNQAEVIVHNLNTTLIIYPFTVMGLEE